MRSNNHISWLSCYIQMNFRCLKRALSMLTEGSPFRWQLSPLVLRKFLISGFKPVSPGHVWKILFKNLRKFKTLRTFSRRRKMLKVSSLVSLESSICQLQDFRQTFFIKLKWSGVIANRRRACKMIYLSRIYPGLGLEGLGRIVMTNFKWTRWYKILNNF